MKQAKHSEQELIILAWKLKELSELNEIGRKLFADTSQVIVKIKGSDAVWERENSSQVDRYS